MDFPVCPTVLCFHPLSVLVTASLIPRNELIFTRSHRTFGSATSLCQFRAVPCRQWVSTVCEYSGAFLEYVCFAVLNDSFEVWCDLHTRKFGTILNNVENLLAKSQLCHVFLYDWLKS